MKSAFSDSVSIDSIRAGTRPIAFRSNTTVAVTSVKMGLASVFGKDAWIPLFVKSSDLQPVRVNLPLHFADLRLMATAGV